MPQRPRLQAYQVPPLRWTVVAAQQPIRHLNLDLEVLRMRPEPGVEARPEPPPGPRLEPPLGLELTQRVSASEFPPPFPLPYQMTESPVGCRLWRSSSLEGPQPALPKEGFSHPPV
jgi:hypothetical protein